MKKRKEKETGDRWQQSSVSSVVVSVNNKDIITNLTQKHK